jgi:hypothetical protein
MGTIISVIGPDRGVGAVTGGEVITGNTSNNVGANLVIKANVLTPDTKQTSLEIRGRMFKTGTVGNCTMRMYFNSTPNLTGTPVLLATHTSSAANIHAQFVRQVYIDKTNTTVFAATQNANTDDTENAAGRTVITNLGNIDYTSDLYLVLAVQNGSAADSTQPVLWFTKTHGY